MSQETAPVFAGFERSNTTPIPDVLFDGLLTELSGAELKVLLYIMRRTWGFKKDTDAISLSQFEHGIITRDGRTLDKGVGLNRETICKALQSLEENGYITSEKQGRSVTIYSIHFKGSRKSEPQWSENPTSQVVGKSAQGSRKIRQKVVGKSDPQETVQETELQETERETQAPTNEQANGVSLSPSFSNSLLVNLTEEQSTFWLRWCAVSGSDPNSINQNAYNHVKFLAEKVLTTDDLQSLYDAAYARIREFSEGTGKSPIPPRLGNLVKAYPEWAQGRALKSKDREEEHKQHAHIPGTGHMRNFTAERLAGKAEPVYVLPKVETRGKRPAAPTGNIDFQDALEQLKQRKTTVGSETRG